MMRTNKAKLIRYLVPGLLLLSVGLLGVGCPQGLDLIGLGIRSGGEFRQVAPQLRDLPVTIRQILGVALTRLLVEPFDLLQFDDLRKIAQGFGHGLAPIT